MTDTTFNQPRAEGRAMQELRNEVNQVVKDMIELKSETKSIKGTVEDLARLMGTHGDAHSIFTRMTDCEHKIRAVELKMREEEQIRRSALKNRKQQEAQLRYTKVAAGFSLLASIILLLLQHLTFK